MPRLSLPHLVPKCHCELLPKFYFWHITESSDQLLAQFDFLREHENEIRAVHSEKRRRERLAIYVLLREAFGPHAALAYTPAGKPYLCNPLEGNSVAQHLSISHTADFLVLSVAAFPHGVDIERYDTRALRLASRFLSREELATFQPDERTATLLWSAKEAAFKQAMLQDNLAVPQIILRKTTDSWLEAIVPQEEKPLRVMAIYADSFVLTYTLKVQS